MKNLRKLIPAIAMLMVSVILLSTSSFAWFSMNTSVTATGMNVKAKSEGGLAIASYTGTIGGAATAPVETAFSTSADASAAGNWLNGNGDLVPTSTANAQTWFTTTAANVNNYAAQTPNSYSQIESSALSGYCRLAKFQVKSLDEGTATSGDSLYVTAIEVTGSSTSPNLDKALRVAIVDASNNAHFFAPVYTGDIPTGTFRYVSSTTATGTYSDNLSFINCTNAAAVQILNGTLTTNPQDISVYVYYEGEDDNCYSLNAVNIDTLSVSVTFSTTNATN